MRAKMDAADLAHLLTRMKDALGGRRIYCNNKLVITQAVRGQEIPRWRLSEASEAGSGAVVVPGTLHKIAPTHREPMYLIPSEFFIAANLAGSTTFEQIHDAILVQLEQLFTKIIDAAEQPAPDEKVSYFAGITRTPIPVMAECFYLTYRRSPGNVNYLHVLDDGRIFAKFSLTLGPKDMTYRPTTDPDWTMNIGPG